MHFAYNLLTHELPLNQNELIESTQPEKKRTWTSINFQKANPNHHKVSIHTTLITLYINLSVISFSFSVKTVTNL